MKHEDLLGEWIRSAGRAFAFGKGDSMWQDAAAMGVFPFDFDRDEREYQLIARPTFAVLHEDMPEKLREVLIVHLEVANFAAGIVSPAQVASALPL